MFFFPGFSLQDVFPFIVHGKSSYNMGDVLRTAFSRVFEINFSEELH